MKLTLACLLVTAGLFLAFNESNHIWINIIGIAMFAIGGHLGNMAFKEKENDYL